MRAGACVSAADCRLTARVSVVCTCPRTRIESRALARACAHGAPEYSQKDITKGLQDFLICVEMALAAVLHRTTFSYRDFASGGALLSALGRRHRLMPSRKALVEMLPLDVVADAQVSRRGCLRRLVASCNLAGA
ncbi:MAG: OSTA/TMEM184 family protein [Promethearchaeia archaeon]